MEPLDKLYMGRDLNFIAHRTHCGNDCHGISVDTAAVERMRESEEYGWMQVGGE